MTTYTPDKWVVIELMNDDTNIVRKVLGSWYGGYAGSDNWRTSSGIIEVIEEPDKYIIVNESGSTYICWKDNQGMSSYTAMIFNGWVEEAEKSNGKYSIKLCTFPEDMI